MDIKSCYMSNFGFNKKQTRQHSQIDCLKLLKKSEDFSTNSPSKTKNNGFHLTNRGASHQPRKSFDLRSPLQKIFPQHLMLPLNKKFKLLSKVKNNSNLYSPQKNNLFFSDKNSKIIKKFLPKIASAKILIKAKNKPKENEECEKTNNENLEKLNKNNNFKYNIQFIYENNFCSAATQKGYILSKDIEKENNQDSCLIIENIFSLDFSIYAIMDGHGSNGHYVSKYIKEKIEEIFCDKKTYIKKNNIQFLNIETIKNKLCKKNFYFIKQFFQKLNTSLYDEVFFDTHFSGSTCNLLFKIKNTLISINIGDSRSILINNNLNNFIELSNDHKPLNEIEKQRILKFGGVISQCNDLYDDGKIGGPFRIWVKGCDYPGIAMSRSLGDKIAHDIGVSCEPDIKIFEIKNDKGIILASDGLWEFLSNKKCVEIFEKYYERSLKNICQKLIMEASDMWVKKNKVVDDITVCVIFLDNVKTD